MIRPKNVGVPGSDSKPLAPSGSEARRNWKTGGSDQLATSASWCARLDSNQRPLASEANALIQLSYGRGAFNCIAKTTRPSLPPRVAAPRTDGLAKRSIDHTKATGSKASTSVRPFLAPGMGHCGGGNGPNEFDKVGALDRWVEQGRTPDTLIASHAVAGKVDRTRPLCAYPQVAKYKGTGSIDEAANFVCAVQ